jgi:AbrB family looped-hinge helix DNA binding protein
MMIARSKLTPQGQISIPVEIRRKLGVGPGSILEWEEGEDEQIVVKRASRFTSEDVHNAIFDQKPPRKELTSLKAGIREHMRKRYAKR